MHKIDTSPTNSHNKIVAIATIITTTVLLLSRIYTSEAQFDWDEELYFQIAKGWSDGLVPYRDIFDHKPPFLYFYYFLFSGFGSKIEILRIVQSIVLLLSIYVAYHFSKKEISIVFVPVLYFLLSSAGVRGTNSEIIYAPFLILLFMSLLYKWDKTAILSMAIVVSIKYTTVFDVAGIVLASSIIQRSLPNLRLIALSIFLFVALNSIFYFYFLGEGVNIVHETITRNILHSSKNRTLNIPFEFMVISAALILACLFLTALQLKKNGDKVSIDVIWFLVAMIIWSAFSFGQALTTGKDYYHYFVPCYIPLSFLIARAVHISSIKFVTPFYLLGCVGACLITLHSSADYVHEIAKSKKRFNEICKLGDFHYDGDLLSIYRICNVTPMKYMFPPFYQDKHFAELSNSGGMEWLKQIDKKIVVDRNEELIIYSSGREYYDKRFGNAP